MFRECFPTVTTRTVGKEISLYVVTLFLQVNKECSQENVHQPTRFRLHK